MAIPVALVALGRIAAAAIARTSVGSVAARVSGSAAVPGASSTLGDILGSFRGLRDGVKTIGRLNSAVSRRQQQLAYTPLGNPQRRQQLTGQIEKLQSKQIAAFGQLASTAATAAKAIGGLTLAAIRVPGHIQQMGAAQIASVRHREAINGSYAVSAARLDFGRFRREQETARGTSASFDALTTSQDALEERTAKYYRAVENIKNWGHATANRAAEAMAKAADSNWINAIPVIGPVARGLSQGADMVNKLSQDEREQRSAATRDLVNFLARGDHRRKPPLAEKPKAKP